MFRAPACIVGNCLFFSVFDHEGCWCHSETEYEEKGMSLTGTQFKFGNFRTQTVGFAISVNQLVESTGTSTQLYEQSMPVI